MPIPESDQSCLSFEKTNTKRKGFGTVAPNPFELSVLASKSLSSDHYHPYHYNSRMTGKK
jgi:hypothetical protein